MLLPPDVPFFVQSPTAPETPVVVEVPHAGLTIDPVALATLTAPARCIGMDADLYVDELCAAAPSLGATLLISRVSRYVCDLNRSEKDIDSSSVENGGSGVAPHGLVWRLTTEGYPAIAAPIKAAEFERRLQKIYRPYHETLQHLLEQKRERFGYAILLSAHSMPSMGRFGHVDSGTTRASIVPGSRGRTTAAARVIDLPDELARKRGWSVVHDVPYRGGFTTAHYGRPAEHIHAIQVEINRRLYMREDALTRLPEQFPSVQAYCSELVHALGALSPEALSR